MRGDKVEIKGSYCKPKGRYYANQSILVKVSRDGKVILNKRFTSLKNWDEATNIFDELVKMVG